jgi:para-nitrobenzyl esterase
VNFARKAAHTFALRSQGGDPIEGKDDFRIVVAPVMRGKASAGDIVMGHMTSGYWAAFGAKGDPNGDERPDQPRYDPAFLHVLNCTNTGVTIGADPLKARLDLWSTVWNRAG